MVSTEHYYSGYKNAQMLVQLMKMHNIRNVIISPGTTHISLVGSLQNDSFFNLYSAIDERGACYMACGLAIESGEPVAITCTGATASRNYLPGLSEAHYKKLPILAITGSHDISCNENLIPQHLDRSQLPKDTAFLSVHLQDIKDSTDEWDCNLKINRALLELRKAGGGPVHINLTVNNSHGMQVKELPPTRAIYRYYLHDVLPAFPECERIAISVGAHKAWTSELTDAVDQFCAEHNAVVLVDHSSGYHGKYRVLPTISLTQEQYKSPLYDIDLLIHIGEHSGDYYTYGRLKTTVKEVWRISPDGELRDTFHKLRKVFAMREIDFFRHYTECKKTADDSYLNACKAEINELYAEIPELPFSNIWLAQTVAPRLPENSSLHLGVSNTMRSWTFFEISDSVYTAANIGCRGIDGALSTTIGMSLAKPERIHFCALGDLTFFYNMNALCNRNVKSNLRILLVNNDGGAEFHNYTHTGHKQFGDDVGIYIAADGHNGRKSPELVKQFVENLGFRYLSASTKEEVLNNLDVFLQPDDAGQPMLMEVFTEHQKESEALQLIRQFKKSVQGVMTTKLKNALGDKSKSFIKKFIKP